MGDFKRSKEFGVTDKTDSKSVQIIAILMALIAFLAPVAVTGYIYGYSSNFIITAMLWSIYMDGYSIHFQLLNIYSVLTVIPFLMFRVAFVYQITRYYQGKTTRGRTIIAAVLSEAPFLAIYIFYILISAFWGGIGLNFPLPIMMIVGLLLLWRFPMHEAIVPWEDIEEPTPWWEEDSEDKEEPTADNQPW